MPRADRLEKIRRLEEAIESPMVCYLTSTREGAEAQIALDAVRIIYEHLRLIGKVPTLSLFLHSNGGEAIVPWKLVTLMREYCEKLQVIVPTRAFSAATLTAMGADVILMHPMGMLGPTDISITGPYNPKGQNNEPLPISVEEVLAFIALVKEDAGIQHEDELVQAFNKLVDHVHPIALGSVKRSHAQSRMIAQKLMELTSPKLDEHRISEIVANLTSRMYYHGHPINRHEAKSLGLRVEDPAREVEDAIWELFVAYEQDMELDRPFHPAREFIRLAPGLAPGMAEIVDIRMESVYVESRGRCDVFAAKHKVIGAKDATTHGVSVQMSTDSLGWEQVVTPEIAATNEGGAESTN